MPSDLVQQLWEGMAKVKLDPRTRRFEEASASSQRPEHFSVCCGRKGPAPGWLQVSLRAVHEVEGLDAFHVLPSELGLLGAVCTKVPGRLKLQPVRALSSPDGRVV